MALKKDTSRGIDRIWVRKKTKEKLNQHRLSLVGDPTWDQYLDGIFEEYLKLENQ